ALYEEHQDVDPEDRVEDPPLIARNFSDFAALVHGFELKRVARLIPNGHKPTAAALHFCQGVFGCVAFPRFEQSIENRKGLTRLIVSTSEFGGVSVIAAYPHAESPITPITPPWNNPCCWVTPALHGTSIST